MKNQAKALRTYFADQGITITHSQALEGTARAHGFKDWNTASAISGDTTNLLETLPRFGPEDVSPEPDPVLEAEIQRDVLWTLLDDIDTASDAFKDNYAGFAKAVYTMQQLRHLVCDGEKVDTSTARLFLKSLSGSNAAQWATLNSHVAKGDLGDLPAGTE